MSAFPTAEAEARTARTLATIERFNEAFGRHDVLAIMALMTDDCLFEGTFPASDGQYYRGQAEVGAFWTAFFTGSPNARFEAEEIFAGGDRGVVRWVYHWTNEAGEPGHVRGVDIFRVVEDKVAEKLSYVKG
jgi:ketosteroid isomerase-like protein